MSNGTHQEITDTVLGSIEDYTRQAADWGAVAEAAINNFAAAAELAMNLDGITYTLNSAIDGYVAPTVPLVPDYGTDGPAFPTLEYPDLVDRIDNVATPGDVVLPVTPIPVIVNDVEAVAPIVTDDPPIIDELVEIAIYPLPTDVSDDVSTSGTPNNPSYTIVVPAASALTYPTYQNLDITDTVAELVAPFDYTEPPYIPLLKTEIQSVLDGVLAGNLVIPTAVWDALWDRAVADVAKVQVTEQWAANTFAGRLGMTGMIGESFLTRFDAAEQKAAERVSRVRIEQAIEESRQRREDMWNAVRDGIAFETMWIQQHNALADRALLAATRAVEMAVAVHQSNIARLNMLVAKAAHYISIGRLELDTVLAKLSEYRVNLERVDRSIAEAQLKVREYQVDWQGWQIEKDVELRTIAEKVRNYIAKWNALQAQHASSVAYEQLKLSKSEVESSLFGTVIGAEAQRHSGDVAYEKLKLEKTGYDINDFIAQWQGIGTQADYTAKVLGVNIDRANFEVSEQRAVLDSEVAAADLLIRSNDSQLRGYEAEWNGVNIRRSAEATTLNALVNLYQGEIQGENVRATYENLELQDAFRLADKTLERDLTVANIQLSHELSVLKDLATLQVGVAQGYLSASDVSLSAASNADASWRQQISGNCSNDVSCIAV